MSKKSKSKKNRKKCKVKHIIAGLYKIKEINRKIKYSKEELQTIIFKSEHGKKMVDELIKEGVTAQWLKTSGKEFALTYLLFACVLKPK